MYEYKVVEFRSPLALAMETYEEELNSLGKQGWNVIHMDAPTHAGAAANKPIMERRVVFLKRLRRYEEKKEQ